METTLLFRVRIPTSPVEVVMRNLCDFLDAQSATQSIAVRFAKQPTWAELLHAASIAHEHHLRFWLRHDELVLESVEAPAPQVRPGLPREECAS